MKPETVRPFIEIIENEQVYLKNIVPKFRGIIGYFCTYTPLELIHSMGFLPVRVTGSSRSVEKAYSLVPSFICPYMRGALEKGLGGEYDFLSGIIQGYTCDAACGMVNIWEENIGGKLFYSMPLPYNSSEKSREFMRTRMLDLVKKLESIGGSFREESLRSSLVLYGEIRRLVLDIYSMRYHGGLPLPARDFLYVILAGFITPPEDYLAMLKTLMSSAGAAAAPEPGGTPVLVSGSIIENPRLFETIEGCGGRIVADDLCTGYRNFFPPSGSGRDAVDALIDRYMNRFPCPSRSRVMERLPRLLELIESSGARGIVFLIQKFCTPHLADHPVLLRELNARGISSLAIEIEESLKVDGQLTTRIESFMEMLR